VSSASAGRKKVAGIGEKRPSAGRCIISFGRASKKRASIHRRGQSGRGDRFDERKGSADSLKRKMKADRIRRQAIE